MDSLKSERNSFPLPVNPLTMSNLSEIIQAVVKDIMQEPYDL